MGSEMCIRDRTVTVRLIRLAVMRDTSFGDSGPHLAGMVVRRGSAVVQLDRALVSSYRLSTVTISLSSAVWRQFAIQVFVRGVGTPVWGNGWPWVGDGAIG